MVGLNANAIAVTYALGAALLGWLFLRFPLLGSRTGRAR
jgi:hypothetical protein